MDSRVQQRRKYLVWFDRKCRTTGVLCPSVPIGALESLLTVMMRCATVERMKGSVMVSVYCIGPCAANGQLTLTSCSLRVLRMLCQKQ